MSKLERGHASVENEEYRKGYRDGYRDAMADQKSRPVWPEPNFPPAEPTLVPTIPWQHSACSKCGGIIGPYQVCRTLGCPMKPIAYNYTGSWHTKTTDNTSGK